MTTGQLLRRIEFLEDRLATMAEGSASSDDAESVKFELEVRKRELSCLVPNDPGYRPCRCEDYPCWAAAKEMIKSAARQFREYERIHKAKGTPDGDIKAAANAHLAKQFEDFGGKL